jgi:hypothetical protein
VLAGLAARARRAVFTQLRPARHAKAASEARFITTAPSPQTAIDAVPESWASRFPPPLDGLRAGDVPLFEDARVEWAFERLGGVRGKSVLDLGPLEGGFSYMAQQAGAGRVVGVEANTMAYLKCLVTKELTNLDRCSFLCGDALEYLSAAEADFDLCIASGLLYHMVEPVRLLDLISQRAAQLFVWTHVYAREALENPALAPRLGPGEDSVYEGFHHRLYRFSYERDTRFRAFWGGTSPYSNWLSRDDLIGALEHFGWSNIQIGFDEARHPNGPALALVAERSTQAQSEPPEPPSAGAQ